MDLGERLISDCEDLIDSNANIEDIREAMNAVYRFYKYELKDGTELSDRRLFNIFKLERKLSDKYLPLNSEPIYDENNEVKFPNVINSEEKCHEALKTINIAK